MTPRACGGLSGGSFASLFDAGYASLVVIILICEIEIRVHCLVAFGRAARKLSSLLQLY